MKKSILILGGANSQMNLIKRAKERGLGIILVDYRTEAPGAALADVHEQISTVDIEGCLKAAVKHRADYVVTGGTDQPVYTAAVVAERLGFPCFLDEKTAKAATNKKAMKNLYKEHGVPTARFCVIGRGTAPERWADFRFPVVIKPLDSAGQRGVYKLNTPEDVLKHMEETLSFSRESECLLEEFYGGRELSAFGYVENGVYRHNLTALRNTIVNGIHIGVASSHLCPCPEHFSHSEEIRSAASGAITALGIKNGPVFMQLMSGADGVKVVETAARVSGGFDDVIQLRLTGLDVIGMALDGAMGIAPKPAFRPADGSLYISVQLFFTQPGLIASIEGFEELCALPFVLDAGINYKAGDVMGECKNVGARFGHCNIIADNLKDLGRYIDKAYDTLRVRGENGRDILLRGSIGPVPPMTR